MSHLIRSYYLVFALMHLGGLGGRLSMVAWHYFPFLWNTSLFFTLRATPRITSKYWTHTPSEHFNTVASQSIFNASPIFDIGPLTKQSFSFIQSFQTFVLRVQVCKSKSIFTPLWHLSSLETWCHMPFYHFCWRCSNWWKLVSGGQMWWQP